MAPPIATRNKKVNILYILGQVSERQNLLSKTSRDTTPNASFKSEFYNNGGNLETLYTKNIEAPLVTLGFSLSYTIFRVLESHLP